MNAKIIRRVFSIVFVSVLALGLVAGTSSQNATQSISDLAWIAGDWQMAPGGKSQSEEHWTAPAGGTMMGMSRTLAGDKTVEFEYLRIEQRTDGIYYVAHPKARCPQLTSS